MKDSRSPEVLNSEPSSEQDSEHTCGSEAEVDNCWLLGAGSDFDTCVLFHTRSLIRLIQIRDGFHPSPPGFHNIHPFQWHGFTLSRFTSRLVKKVLPHFYPDKVNTAFGPVPKSKGQGLADFIEFPRERIQPHLNRHEIVLRGPVPGIRGPLER